MPPTTMAGAQGKSHMDPKVTKISPVGINGTPEAAPVNKTRAATLSIMAKI